jgi:alpha-galactosidase
MKIRFIKWIILSALICFAPALFAKDFSVNTAHFILHFQTGADGRLYQQPIGDDSNSKLSRDAEFYPQAGDGYVWESAIQIVHADGNT